MSKPGSRTPNLREQLLSLRRRLSDRVGSVEHIIASFRDQKEFAMDILQEAENDIILCADEKLKQLAVRQGANHDAKPNLDKDAIVGGARDLVDEIDMQKSLIEAEERSMGMQLANLKQLQYVAQQAARDCSYRSLHQIHMQLAEQMRSMLEDLPNEDVLDVKAYRFVPSTSYKRLGTLDEWMVTYEDKGTSTQTAVLSQKDKHSQDFDEGNKIEKQIHTMARNLSSEASRKQDDKYVIIEYAKPPHDESEEDGFDIKLDDFALKNKGKDKKVTSSFTEPSPSSARVRSRLSSLDEFMHNDSPPTKITKKKKVPTATLR